MSERTKQTVRDIFVTVSLMILIEAWVSTCRATFKAVVKLLWRLVKKAFA